VILKSHAARLRTLQLFVYSPNGFGGPFDWQCAGKGHLDDSFLLITRNGLLNEVLKRIRSSASLEHVSHLGTSLALRLELAYAENRDSCLGFLQRCVQYVEIMTCPSHIGGPVSSHAESLDTLRECGMKSRFETTDISAESAVRARGLSSNQLSHLNGLH